MAPPLEQHIIVKMMLDKSKFKEILDANEEELDSIESISLAKNKTTGETRMLVKGMKDQKDVQLEINKQTKKFRMELLSVMFFGMSMQRIFGGQISRMKDMIGIGTMMQSMFTVSLIGPMMKISGLVSIITTKFMELPEKIQGAAGWTMMGTFVAGGTLSFIGQVGLGVAGISVALGKLGKVGGPATKAGTTLADFGFAGKKALGKAGLGAKLASSGVWALAIGLSVYGTYKILEDINEIELAWKDAKVSFLDYKAAVDAGVPTGDKFIAPEDLAGRTMMTDGPLPWIPIYSPGMAPEAAARRQRLAIEAAGNMTNDQMFAYNGGTTYIF